MRRPLIANKQHALILGALLFIAGSVLLYDAFDGRGDTPPWPLGALLPF